ncbi:hypothetical protein TWF506_004330 [Arthrobotrys conoides]|uniref:Uncharacterized protein n=1 Tax=Arthrobotrys conoides TaxID=74498 RepID=A0AAN8N2Z0_9PEZI
MAYENADAADMRRYLNSRVQEMQLPEQSDSQQENSSPTAKQHILGTESSATLHSLERNFARIEIQSPQSPQNENAAFDYNGGGENATPTSRKSNKSESQSAFSDLHIPRITENAEKENFDLPTYLDTSEDDDSDLDDEADKVSFHKVEIQNILAEETLNTALLLVHLKSLVETYKVSDDPEVLLFLSVLYLSGTTPSGANIEETGKCLNILSTFKHNNIMSVPADVDDSLGQFQATRCTLIYLIRAMAYFRLRNYSAAYKDCRRTISLGKKLKTSPSSWWDFGKDYTRSAYEIAAASSKLMGDDGNMLYYRSLCEKKETQVSVLIGFESFELPTISELSQELPSISNAVKTAENSSPLDWILLPDSTQGLPDNVIRRSVAQESNIPLEGEQPKGKQMEQYQRNNPFFQNNEDKIYTLQNSSLIQPAQAQEISRGGKLTTQVGEVSRVHAPPTPPPKPVHSAIIENRSFDIDQEPEGLLQSRGELDLSVIIPPSLPGNARMSWFSPKPFFSSQTTIIHRDKINNQIFTVFNSNTMSLGSWIPSLWLDLINDFDGVRIPDALKLTFKTYEDIIRVINHCIKNNQKEIASAILTKGRHYCQGQWLEIGYGYQLNCLPWVNTSYKEVKSLWHFLPALLASEPGVDDSYVAECVSFLSVVLGFPLSTTSPEPKTDLLQETLVISLAVGNTTMASAIAKYATHLLTAEPSRPLPLLFGNHGYILAPLPLSVILESKQGYRNKSSLLSLLKRSFWESTESNCKVYDLNLFHVAARYTTFSTGPLSYLLQNHKCRRCVTKFVEDVRPGVYVTPFDIVLSRAATLGSFRQGQYGILVDIANLFYQHEAAYINDFVFRKEEIEVLDSAGFPSLFSIRRIPNRTQSWA